MIMTKQTLLKVEDLKTYFAIKRGLLQRTVGHVKAVDGISFEIEKGKTLGLVGESGCGKTTAARTIAKLIKATGGSVSFDGDDVSKLKGANLNQFRQDVSVIFQDPYSSLNPRMTVGNIIGEPIHIHKKIKGRQLRNMVEHLLERVGLSANYINRYPHEFSGGQRQRVGIARALALEPKLVICDEPVSALDVSIQSQVLNLLCDLQDEFGLTFLFIAHDLAVVEFISDEVAVMYLGRIVERASSKELYTMPMHPYTRVLMSAIPTMDTSQRGVKKALGGEIPSPSDPPSGCPFHPRCPIAEEKCSKQMPQLEDVGGGHFVACWRADFMNKKVPN